MIKFLALGISLLLLSFSAQDDLTAILEEYIQEDEPGVVVYVAYHGETASAAYGSANLDTGEPIQVDDLFRIGSTTKPMVATVMLTLVDAGEISLDDPIADYLPVEIVENVANADSATVRQMLQMTSGIFDYTESDAFDDAITDDPQHFWTPEEVMTYTYGEEPYFNPGDEFYYSNSNYILAQIIIEQLTGMSLADALETVIFEPLGMTGCYLETEANFAQNIVRGYGYDEDITEENDGVGMGDGGVICPAEDLAKFLPGLLNGEIISGAMLEEMLDTVEDDSESQYGLGIGYDEDEDYGVMISHDGATSGFQSVMFYNVDSELTVIVLTNNFDAEYMEDVTWDIVDLVLGE